MREQMDESTPQKTGVNAVECWAEFMEPMARGMWCRVKRCVCAWSLLGLSRERFGGRGMHAGLFPCRVKKILFIFSCDSR